METLEEAQLCFPAVNNSCKKSTGSHLEAVMIYTLLSLISVLTVVLNLVVVISISHFRQLHTTTNILLLSLAIADFLVGSVQMPQQMFYYGDCWLLGDFGCALYCSFGYIIVSVSVGNMVLISIDRYVAICDPMLYPTKVTMKRVQFSIYLCWIFSVLHGTWILRDFLQQPGRYNSCYGECVLIVHYADGVVDLVVTFLAPIIVITVLYMSVFVVVVSQARAMRSNVTSVAQRHSGTITAQKSELKAARTLGILVVVFLLCSSPYYIFTLAAENHSVEPSAADAQLWLLYFNSCLNPVIYAFCYPWFRKSIKHIVTLKILQPDSKDTNIL
ncbi:trace amine-associated receptor 13c-like [Sphaeramia orbicularis]|uniref:trace amine-associated receptor 13c-like n=1 Tax=Sphaeramia orbicularis TaxID=375764 RepID=UPI00117CB7E8|nr:trace amine-associated receptor 13c-like [Sphaeramia orbicularis]